MIDLASLLRFPCDRDKHPLITAWQRNASRRDHSHWPLVGVPTGTVNGFDVLDIDLAALGWRDQNRDRFPLTQVHTTRSGGWHFLFKHHEGLRNSASRIAPGVDVRADGGFVIWWAREGLPFTHAELAEWPEWLLELAKKAKRATNTNLRHSVPLHVVSDLTEALRKMDPRDWHEDWDRWFELLMGCKFVGITLEDFTEWSVRDPDYAGDGEEIARQWESVVPKHGGAFYAALKARGIKVRPRQEQGLQERGRTSEVHGSRASTIQRTRTSNRDLHFQHATIKPRIDGLLRRLQRMATEQELFNSACFMAELTPMPPQAARGLLEQTVKETALWAQLGRDGVRKTIERGFAHIETKRSTLTNERRHHA
jgi:hypothetical protein